MSQGLFTSLFEAGDPFVLIDTRERRDHVNGHWFGSTNIPLSVLTLRLDRLVPDRDFPIHLLDWQDKPSEAAARQLSRLGYTNVTRCKTQQPETFGRGFVKGEFVWSKAFGEVVAHTSGLLEVTPEEYLANYRDAHLFDVRPTAEYSQFTIPNSQSLPNSLLLGSMEVLKQEAGMALLHCAGRTRSIIGACTLKAAGYDGAYAIFKGGTQAWQLDGLEREFNASRLFAKETDDSAPVIDFLNRWNITYQTLENADLGAFVSAHNKEHLFDVSDDAATGQATDHTIVKVSGTNLIQQTDRSIARYHVPVILFDHGSGSRAAFAAYWLQTMGYDVSIVFLTDKLVSQPSEDKGLSSADTTFEVFSTQQLLERTDSTESLIDVRTSQDYSAGHIKGSQWGNISELLIRGEKTTEPAVIIGDDIQQASEHADLLAHQGWQIAGLYSWNLVDIDQGLISTTTIDTPIDKSALFGQRHHGNLQDSRDYLAWEEDLPEEIDQEIHQLWHQLLEKPAI